MISKRAMKPIRMVIIEHNHLLRDGIVVMLKKQTDINIVAAFGGDIGGLVKAHRLKPNVILLDSGLRSQHSLRVVELIKSKIPSAKVIVMDLAPVQADIAKFVKAGASGFILRNTSLDDLLSTIHAVTAGTAVASPIRTESLFTEIIEHALKAGKTTLRRGIRMTAREQEVIRLLSNGLSDKDIGERLQMSSHAIKYHIHTIMEKLALHMHREVGK